MSFLTVNFSTAENKRYIENVISRFSRVFTVLKAYNWGDLMSKEVSFNNRDRFIQLGIAIASLRKLRGMSQDGLAEKAGISRSLLSVIEAPAIAHSFSLGVFYNIADALSVDPADLIKASVFSDKIINKK